MFAVGCKREHCPQISGPEIWEIGEDLGLRHAGRQILKRVLGGDAKSTDRRQNDLPLSDGRVLLGRSSSLTVAARIRALSIGGADQCFSPM
ncbi:MAG: hypothetical protein JOY62_13445 [Acidobacteriaceae bacterium]|nr:hypothetical protein [Acidobacteriaceae bacterium]MBV9780966.1 hypothetical protein [Acidobacteriaceae bacterium]